MADIASFKKMLKAGVPRGAVELRCQAAGLDPALLDQVGQFTRTRARARSLSFLLSSLFSFSFWFN